MLSGDTLTGCIQITYSHNNANRDFFIKIPEVLTKSEKAVLCHLLRGMRVSDIAKKLHRSIKTISNQKRALYTKLNIKSDVTLFCDLYFDGIIKIRAEEMVGKAYNPFQHGLSKI